MAKSAVINKDVVVHNLKGIPDLTEEPKGIVVQTPDPSVNRTEEKPKEAKKQAKPKSQQKKAESSNEATIIKRPPKRREVKGRYNLAILPSLYDSAQEKAKEEGISLSEVISFYLKEYYLQE